MKKAKRGYFKCRPARKLDGFVAWAGLEPLSADDPLDEPEDTEIFFRFAPTETAAIAVVQDELRTRHGVETWERQKAS